MGKKKKRRPKHKHLTREGRLKIAKAWIEKVTHNNPLKAYRRQFKVDYTCAITEFKLLGISLDSDYVQTIQNSIMAHLAAKRQRRKTKKAKTAEIDCHDSDATYAYIAGYTDGGAPYGITWEEQRQLEKRKDQADNEHPVCEECEMYEDYRKQVKQGEHQEFEIPFKNGSFLGEASVHIPHDVRLAHPDVPWKVNVNSSHLQSRT